MSLAYSEKILFNTEIITKTCKNVSAHNISDHRITLQI